MSLTGELYRIGIRQQARGINLQQASDDLMNFGLEGTLAGRMTHPAEVWEPSNLQWFVSVAKELRPTTRNGIIDLFWKSW